MFRPPGPQLFFEVCFRGVGCRGLLGAGRGWAGLLRSMSCGLVSHKVADYLFGVFRVSWCNHIIPTMSNCPPTKDAICVIGAARLTMLGNMRTLLGATLGIGAMVFGSLSASSNYSLQTYSIGPGASNSASSSNYSVE